MSKRIVPGLLVAMVTLLAAARPASAQQTLNITFGHFAPRGEDARAEHDVLAADRDYLTFEIGDFSGPTIGGEWLIPLGNFFEAGAGVSFSRRTVPTFYTDYVDTSGDSIEQELRLRIVPVAFTFRALPLGQSSPIQPYIGGGLGIFLWRYSETGDFIDFSAGGLPVFHDSFVDSGNTTGGIVLGGIRFASDRVSAGGEIRYQTATADLDTSLFRDSKLDLSGWTYQFTVGIRFGK